jgi:hypothetical protein
VIHHSREKGRGGSLVGNPNLLAYQPFNQPGKVMKRTSTAVQKPNMVSNNPLTGVQGLASVHSHKPGTDLTLAA